MTKQIIAILTIFFTTLTVQAYEDCIVTGPWKLTDISIEDNTVVDVYPLVTLMNDKNTLIVHPLKTGQTRFCVLKNGKNIAMFTIKADEFDTEINAPEGFEVLTLDPPTDDIEFTLDEPPSGAK